MTTESPNRAGQSESALPDCCPVCSPLGCNLQFPCRSGGRASLPLATFVRMYYNAV